MAVGLPCRDDPDDLLDVALFVEGVGDDEQEDTAHHAEGLPALFPFGDSLGNGEMEGVLKDLGGFLKGEAVLALVSKVLGLIPFEADVGHGTIVIANL